MKRLILIIISLFILGVMGFFATQNNENVSLKVYKNFEINLSVWMLIVGSFISGWLFTEVGYFFSNPGRFLNIFFGKFSKYKEKKVNQLKDSFEEAILLRNSKNVIKYFNRLYKNQVPLTIKVKYLEQLNYVNSKDELLKKFAKLDSEFQGNLEVLLPYLKLACQVDEWDIAERLCQEILIKNSDHPDALEGLRQCYIARKDWVQCIEKERRLLEKFSGSLFTENLNNEHELNLQKAIIQDPNCLKKWNFSYFNKKRDKKNDKKLEIIGKSNRFKEKGLYWESGKVLKEAFKSNPLPLFIEELEDLYFESGLDERITEIVREIYTSRNSTFFVSVLFAKILYKNGKFEDAKKVLNEDHSNSFYLNFQKKSPEEKIEEKEISERWKKYFHVLRFFLEVHDKSYENAVNEIKTLLSEEEYFGKN